MALKYAGPGNPASLRGAAFMVLAESGKGNDRALNILTAALKEPSEQLVFNALQALGGLGDPRALPALDELVKRTDLPGFAKPLITATINRIKKAADAGGKQ
jgi:HEAT repeat protein